MITYSRLNEKLQMQSRRLIVVALVSCGGALILAGLGAADIFGARLSHFFAESAAEMAMWLVVSGVAVLLTGASMSYKTAQQATK